jgi:uncharacterized protein (UPF0332 family)
MSIQDLLKNNHLELISISVTDSRLKHDRALRNFNFYQKTKFNPGDEDVVYKGLYDSLLIACQSFLLLNGYRVKSSIKGHHLIIITATELLMPGEITNEFKRMKMMRSKRNEFEYGNPTTISTVELNQAISDIGVLLRKIDQLIAGQESRLPI